MVKFDKEKSDYNWKSFNLSFWSPFVHVVSKEEIKNILQSPFFQYNMAIAWVHQFYSTSLQRANLHVTKRMVETTLILVLIKHQSLTQMDSVCTEDCFQLKRASSIWRTHPWRTTHVLFDDSMNWLWTLKVFSTDACNPTSILEPS